ncbi:MAG: hypothetical protein HQL08_03365 [Nitrospirae bacterium]|nr:hypothetical protein [Nitrospirota bacterium]
MKLLKTTLYYYCLPTKFKKQVSSYLCETKENNKGTVVYEDPNGNIFSIDEKDINYTRFLGLVDAEYAIVFSLIGTNLNVEGAEKTICQDSVAFFGALETFAREKG